MSNLHIGIRNGGIQVGEKNLKAGFSMLDITPPLGVNMTGYFGVREASGVLDPLYASALAISNGDETLVMMSCDLLAIDGALVAQARELIQERWGIPGKNIMIHATHIHTGPATRVDAREVGPYAIMKRDEPYLAMLVRKLADTAHIALSNMKDATLKIGYGREESIAFIRRFRMKDGSVRTNPGVGNPDIVEPMGALDPTVGVIRVNFSGDGSQVLLVNFALHADIVGGTLFSADFPGHMRRVISTQLPKTNTLFFNGAAGDVNHIDSMNPGRTFKGYEYSRKVGTILAAEVLKVCQRMDAIGGTLKGLNKIVRVPVRRVSQEEVEKAKERVTAFKQGNLKTKDMGGVGELASSYQTIALSETDGTRDLELHALSIGDVAFLGMPGEIFTAIGRNIKKNSPFTHTFIVELANGSFGYFPTKDAFLEGGYETKNTPFTGEVEKLLVDASLELLKELKEV